MALDDSAREANRKVAQAEAAKAPRLSEAAVARLRALLRPRQVQRPDTRDRRP